MHPAIPLINWRGLRYYSVPTTALGQTVEVHHPVDSTTFTIRWAGQTIATHTQRPSGHDDVWDPEHHREAVHAALTAATGRHLHPVNGRTDAHSASEASQADGSAGDRLDVGDGYDVQPPDLGVYGDGLEGSA